MNIKYSNRYEVTLFLLSEIGQTDLKTLHRKLTSFNGYESVSILAVRQHLKTARTYKHVLMNGTGNKFCKYELTDSGQSYVRNHMNEIEAI